MFPTGDTEGANSSGPSTEPCGTPEQQPNRQDNDELCLRTVARRTDQSTASHSTVCGKKVSPKVFLPFSQQPLGIFTRNFTSLSLFNNHVKLLNSIVLFLTVTKLLNFLGDQVVISDVHGMLAERKTHHIL